MHTLCTISEQTWQQGVNNKHKTHTLSTNSSYWCSGYVMVTWSPGFSATSGASEDIRQPVHFTV